ncbi:cytochrome b5-like heme/steroid binding domain-containing protein [Melampsora americana]|nr:cytochrome b5-like heme/steroid binding domain-containing protein [Melampsora americana]
MSSNEKVYSTKEVETHSTEQSAWVIIEGGVYDVTEFLEDHPGGKEILLSNCGKDSTELFEEYHTKKILVKTGGPMKIGVVGADSKM